MVIELFGFILGILMFSFLVGGPLLSLYFKKKYDRVLTLTAAGLTFFLAVLPPTLFDSWVNETNITHSYQALISLVNFLVFLGLLSFGINFNLKRGSEFNLKNTVTNNPTAKKSFLKELIIFVLLLLGSGFIGTIVGNITSSQNAMKSTMFVIILLATWRFGSYNARLIKSYINRLTVKKTKDQAHDELVKFNELRNLNIITEDEYQRKAVQLKGQILND